MTYKVLAQAASCPATTRLLVVGEMVGAKVDFSPTKTASEEVLLVTPNGIPITAAAGLRYFARMRPDLGLYGSTFFETALVDTAMDHSDAHVWKPLRAMRISTDEAEKKKLLEKVKSSIGGCVDSRLGTSTFLVGERLTIADVDLALALNAAFSRGILDINSFDNVKRWMDLVMNQDAVKKFTMKAEDKAAALKAHKSLDTQTNGKVPKSAADIEEEIAAQQKANANKANPLDSLPPTPLVLDAWKREYSNCKDLKGVAMPWFWNNFDNNGWSIWYMRYHKMEGENTVGFTTANMLGGFLQRLDANFRKYSFAVNNVVGEAGNFDIQGVWMVRGQEIPFELKDHPSYEYFNFKKLNVESDADKQLITDYWCNDDRVEGRPIDSCKVWK